MNGKLLLAGIGGQGVLFAHQLLARCAAEQGYDVTGAETHGMSQRGGAVVSHVKIRSPSSPRPAPSGQLGDAPLIRQGTADFLIAFAETEALRALPFLRRGGTLVVNTASPRFLDDMTRAGLDEHVTVRALDAMAIAERLGRRSVANVVLLGFASTCRAFPLTGDALRAALQGHGSKSWQSNLQAFDEGVRAGSDPHEPSH